MLQRSSLQVIAIALALTASLACSRVHATREFNHGIRYFKENNYAAAARAFERASETLDLPEVKYNLALSHLHALKVAPDRSEDEVRAALASVADALEAPGVTVSTRARLHYIAGSIHRLQPDEPKARTAFNRALKESPLYAPALRALLELEPDRNSPLARLVLATAVIEEPTLEEKLSL